MTHLVQNGSTHAYVSVPGPVKIVSASTVRFSGLQRPSGTDATRIVRRVRYAV